MTPGADDGEQTRTPDSPEADEQENLNGDKSSGWNGYGPPPVREYTPIKPAVAPEPTEPTESAEPVASSDSAEPARPAAWNGYGPPPAREDEASATPAPSSDAESAEPTPSTEPEPDDASGLPDPVVESTDAVEPAEADEPVAAGDSTESAEATESADDEWDGTGPPPIRRREPVIPVYPKTPAAPKGPVPGPGPRARQGGRWTSDEESGPPPSNRMAIAAIILGAASIPFGLTGYLGVIAGLFAIVFGIIGLRQAKRGRSTRPRLALAGTILGVVGLVLSIVVLVVSVNKINDCKKHIGHTPNRQELTQCAREHI